MDFGSHRPYKLCWLTLAAVITTVSPFVYGETSDPYLSGYDNGYQQAVIEHQQLSAPVKPAKKSELHIETVTLTSQQLAELEYQKAEKALQQMNSDQAVGYFKSALRYRPDWALVQQKLAVLYYGKGERHQAILLLQQGITQKPQAIELRLTLAKLFVNEKHYQAALDALSQPIFSQSRQFLAMRAALAQQQNHTSLALSSYRQLVKMDAMDGRWWLGLAIAEERSSQLDVALNSYRKALTKQGISLSSQQFIQERIKALQTQRS